MTIFVNAMYKLGTKLYQSRDWKSILVSRHI